MKDNDKILTIFLGGSSLYNFYDGNTVFGVILAVVTALIIGFYGGMSYKDDDYRGS